MSGVSVKSHGEIERGIHWGSLVEISCKSKEKKGVEVLFLKTIAI